MVKHADGWLVVEEGPEAGMMNLANVDRIYPDADGKCVMEFAGEDFVTHLDLDYDEVKAAITAQDDEERSW